MYKDCHCVFPNYRNCVIICEWMNIGRLLCYKYNEAQQSHMNGHFTLQHCIQGIPDISCVKNIPGMFQHSRCFWHIHVLKVFLAYPVYKIFLIFPCTLGILGKPCAQNIPDMPFHTKCSWQTHVLKIFLTYIVLYVF